MSMQKLWNDKYSRDGYLYGKEPNAFLKEQLKNIKKESSILFLGEGEGRNACYAASLGFKTTALDASDIGISKCQELAKAYHVNVTTLHVDLAHWKAEQKFDVVMSSFLHLQEPLRTHAFSQAIQALKSNGLFIAEFFSQKQLPLSSGGPKDLSLLYDAQELQELFLKLDVTPYLISEVIDELDEGAGHQGEAQLIRVIVKKNSR
ncbi:MAG: class I SAM-dependent methyltransferase [Campylobacterota bacterium]|nr:class I SAM-dependent methyltransferase [Campylobacterota bacterium]